MTRRLAALLVAVTVFVVAPPRASAQATTGTLFTLTDPHLDEASGIARGVASPDVYYVQNDSGDTARFFALDAHSGRVRAVYTVPGAQNHDWEDLAVAPDSHGVASIWLADIGDNQADRPSVRLYRVDEPHVDMSRYDVPARTGRPEVWRLRYPSGPANAESLAVAPSGRAYVVTKATSGRSIVYSVPRTANSGRLQPMTRIGAITFRAQRSLIPADLQVLATGAALSADGTVLAVRTYTEAYVWTVRGGDVAAAIRAAPVRVSLPLQPQGEGVCIVGADLVIDSEHVGSDVSSVPLPGSVRPKASPTPTATRSPSSAQSSLPSSAQSTTAPSPRSTGESESSRPALAWSIALAVAVVAVGVVYLGYVRRRRRRG